MARRAVRSYGFVSPFIASDDSALGQDADYDKYIETLDERYLDLQPGEPPDRFFIKRLDARSFVEIQGLLEVIVTDSEESVDNVAAVEAMEAFSCKVVSCCVRGVENFEYIISSDREGNVSTENLSIEKGVEPTPEQVDIISQDKTLVNEIFRFVTSLSMMSEAQKKT